MCPKDCSNEAWVRLRLGRQMGAGSKPTSPSRLPESDPPETSDPQEGERPTCTFVLPVLTRWPESPRYAAITDRVPVDFGVKVTVQLAEPTLIVSPTLTGDRLQLRRAGKAKSM